MTGGKKLMTKTKKNENTENNSVKKTSTKFSSMEELLKKQDFKPPKKGKEIDAKIIFIDKKNILFDIGFKTYAVLGELETKELPTYLSYLKQNDVVKVMVVVEESKEGYPVVSMRKFFEKGKWEILTEKQKNEEEIEVLCGEYGKGGVFIEFMGIRGVIPKIQLTEDLIENPSRLVNQKIKVKVLEVDKIKNRLVVSQKAVALKISYKDLKKEFDEIKVGEVYKAKVIGFSDFGVFCEVNKIEGLIHISEISWQKISDPTSYVKVGDIIDVKVIEKNETNYKLNLSIKRLKQDPWEKIEEKYVKDKEFEGEIIRKEKYGYILRFEPGVEGLIHVSKLGKQEELEIGSKIKVFIEKIDIRNRRMSLITATTEKPVFYR